MPESVFGRLKPKMCHASVSVSRKEISCLSSPGVLCLVVGLEKSVCPLKLWVAYNSVSLCSFIRQLLGDFPGCLSPWRICCRSWKVVRANRRVGITPRATAS